jgi:para-nitrobenzyl esterase
MKPLCLILLSAALVSPLGGQCPCMADLPGNLVQVAVANGILEGRIGEDGVEAFRGIPYAQPPIDNLRWAEPQPPASWKGIRTASTFGPRPEQLFMASDMIFRSQSMSEDCLYLNVWSRAPSPTAGFPVLVYFNGGGLVAGDGSEYRYDGASMARKDIVVVTVNYREGIFGFLSLPDLTRESPHHASGNYGHLDQVAALFWVRRNIAAFGGDPQRVTIGGQSAGSSSVSALMASPLARGLFQGAIGESGSILGNPEHFTLAQAEAEGLAFAAKAGAPSLAALRALPASQLLELARGRKVGRRTLVDGYFFTETPEEVFSAGRQADVPVLAGWNSAEMSASQVLGTETAIPEHFAAAVKALYGSHAGEVLALYPASTPEEALRSATDLASDRPVGIAYRTWKWMAMQAGSGGKPVFRYLFSQPPPPERDSSEKTDITILPPVPLGPHHSAEIPYALGNLPLVDARLWTPADYKASEAMQGYFANFIKTGDPNGPGLPQWTSMQTGIPRVMVLTADPHLVPEAHLDRYRFIDSLN